MRPVPLSDGKLHTALAVTGAFVVVVVVAGVVVVFVIGAVEGATVGGVLVAPLHLFMHSSTEAKLLELPPLPLNHMTEHPDPV